MTTRTCECSRDSALALSLSSIFDCARTKAGRTQDESESGMAISMVPPARGAGRDSVEAASRFHDFAASYCGPRKVPWKSRNGDRPLAKIGTRKRGRGASDPLGLMPWKTRYYTKPC
jgi:hypothetical protein